MIWHEQGSRGWSIDLFEFFKHLKQTVLTLSSVDILFNLTYWLYANCCCCLHKFWPLKREHQLPSYRPNTEENVEKQQQLWYFQTSHRKTQTSNVSCLNLAGGHPTCFLHWDIFFKKDKKKILKNTKKTKRATLLKEGNCACALRRCTCGKKKHITQTFFGISEYYDLWFQLCFITNLSLCANAKTFVPYLTVAPPAVNTWLCKRKCRLCFFHVSL